MTGKTMPNPLVSPSSLALTIGHLIGANAREREADFRHFGHPAERYLCGYPLPAFQRGLAWSHEQSMRFIESAWLGFELGKWVVTADAFVADEGHEGQRALDPRSGLLIDGQQRLAAIEAYTEDAFPVFGAYWSEVDAVDQRRFRQTSFACGVIPVIEEAKLRELYDRLNFGGTPHRAHERVSASTSDPGPGEAW